MPETRNRPVRSAVRARHVFLREAVSEGGPVILACGGLVSLAVGGTLVGVFGLPLPWAVVAVVLVFALIVFEGAFRTNARLREELAEWEAWSVSLPELVLGLIREGRRLKDRIVGAPLMKETSPGSYEGPVGTDPEAMREVDAFDVRARDLLTEHDDSLLQIYAAAARAAQAEDSQSSGHDDSGLAPVLTPKLYAEMQKGQPLADLDAYLSGLAAVRHKLLDWGAQRPSRSRAS